MPAPEFVKELLRRYYVANEIAVPGIAQREFGFGFESKIDYRHKAFGGQREFNDFLRREAPPYASHSTARYSMPAARPMSRKGFLGADLAFDLDKTYESEHPDSHNEVICAKCLKRSGEDALRFYEEFLSSDFGFSRSDVFVNFSGNKGFHFHVRSQAVQPLSASARKQLCDYAGGFEVNGEAIFYEQKKGNYTGLAGPAPTDGGWQGKVYSSILELVAAAELPQLQQMGLTKRKAEKLFSKRDAVIASIRAGKWEAVNEFTDFWRAVADEAVRRHRVELDKPVSFDLARLIRVPNTIHGSTGLVAKPVDDLAKFEPLKDAVAFSSKERLAVVSDRTVSFEIGGQSFDATAGARVELPLSAALLLYCRGIAKPA